MLGEDREMKENIPELNYGDHTNAQVKQAVLLMRHEWTVTVSRAEWRKAGYFIGKLHKGPSSVPLLVSAFFSVTGLYLGPKVD